MPIEPQTSIPTDPLVSRTQRDSLTRVIRRAEAGDVSIQAERQVVRDLIASEGFSGRAPEQCVVAFKTLLNEAAIEAGFALGRERTSLQERLVSMFIAELYQAGSTGADDHSSRDQIAGSRETLESPSVGS